MEAFHLPSILSGRRVFSQLFKGKGESCWEIEGWLRTGIWAGLWGIRQMEWLMFAGYLQFLRKPGNIKGIVEALKAGLVILSRYTFCHIGWNGLYIPAAINTSYTLKKGQNKIRHLFRIKRTNQKPPCLPVHTLPLPFTSLHQNVSAPTEILQV